MKTIPTLFLLSALTVPVGAETLTDYLNEATANNPQLAAVHHQWQSIDNHIEKTANQEAKNGGEGDK